MQDDTIWDGRYRLEERLGEGAASQVYRARQLADDRPVALKLYKPRPGFQQPRQTRAFCREVLALGELSHPNVVKLLGSGSVDADGLELHYVVTELLEGARPLDRLARIDALPPRWAIERVIELADAAASAHAQGLVHRDIKPANVLIQRDRAVLIDFSLVSEIDPNGLLGSSHGAQGTPTFAAPEQLAGLPVNEATDIYSLGGLLLWLLTGRAPNPVRPGCTLDDAIEAALMPAPDVRSLPHIDRELQAIYDRALDADLTRRWPSALALSDALTDYLAQRDSADTWRLISVGHDGGEVPLASGEQLEAGPGARVPCPAPLTLRADRSGVSVSPLRDDAPLSMGPLPYDGRPLRHLDAIDCGPFRLVACAG